MAAHADASNTIRSIGSAGCGSSHWHQPVQDVASFTGTVSACVRIWDSNDNHVTSCHYWSHVLVYTLCTLCCLSEDTQDRKACLQSALASLAYSLSLYILLVFCGSRGNATSQLPGTDGCRILCLLDSWPCTEEDQMLKLFTNPRAITRQTRESHEYHESHRIQQLSCRGANSKGIEAKPKWGRV